jgi:putative RecB family exonuclease
MLICNEQVLPQHPMPYQLSATKLQTYQRCPQQYYLRYDQGLTQPAFFSSAVLGIALHKALATLYWDWDYQIPLPEVSWIRSCWERSSSDLTPAQTQEGLELLEQYYWQFIVPSGALRKPIAVEGRIQGTLLVENLEFAIAGRYDRLSYLDEGLELVDYKTGKDFKLPDSAATDLQLGLYSLAIQQRYQQALKQCSLIHLRSGEMVTFEVNPQQQQQVMQVIQDLALQLRFDEQWQAQEGEHCQKCGYRRYCPALQKEPEALPCVGRSQRESVLQLALTL